MLGLEHSPACYQLKLHVQNNYHLRADRNVHSSKLKFSVHRRFLQDSAMISLPTVVFPEPESDRHGVHIR